MILAHTTMRPMALAVTLALIHFDTVAQSAMKTLPEIEVSGNRETGDTYNPPTATTATRMEAPLRDIPQTVTVVPQELLRDQAVRSMEEALKSVPGVGLSHGDGQRDQVSIRGFTAIGDQFIDGLRDDALYFRDLSNIQQVEVLKGPAAVLYGRGSSGGLINRITKKPGIDLTEVKGQIGSYEQRRGEFDIARNLENGNVAFRVTGSVERADSYRDKQFLNREAFAPSVLFKISSATDLLLQAEYLSDRRITDFGIPAFQGRPVDVPRSTYYGAANARDVDTSESRVKAAGFTLNHRFSDTLSLRNGFRYYEYDLDRNNTLVSGVNEANLTATLLHGNVLREEDGYFNQTELTQKATLAGLAHQILYGVELGKQDKDQFVTRQPVGTVSLFNPVLPNVPLRATTVAIDNVGTLETSSAYIQDLITLSPQWKALAGVRFDRFKQETEERRAGQPNLSRTDTEWSPRVGLVYQPTLSQSYYASVSRSFQPSAELQPLTANAVDFAPEETTNKEIGAKLDFIGGRASATASLFELERTNIKETDPVTRAVVPIGEQRTRGLELMFTGELPRGWEIWSGYAYLHTEVTSSPNPALEGRRATLTPKHSANLWLVKSLANGWRAGAGLNYVDDRAADPANRVTLPGYTTVEAMAAYTFNKLDLQLNVYNLFDREYIVSGHGVSPNLNLPGVPRTAQLTVRYRF
jgi:catecholate siderophore receptor